MYRKTKTSEVAYRSFVVSPEVLRYGAHCYLQGDPGLSFSLSWNTRSIAGRGVPENPGGVSEMGRGFGVKLEAYVRASVV